MVRPHQSNKLFKYIGLVGQGIQKCVPKFILFINSLGLSFTQYCITFYSFPRLLQMIYRRIAIANQDHGM